MTGAEEIAEGTTGVAAMPGCDLFEITLPGGPLEVNNLGQQYVILIGLGPGATSYSAVRVFYRSE